MQIDEVMKSVGVWGRYQTMIYTLVFVASIPNSFLTMQFVISHYEPDHRCRLPEEIETLLQNVTYRRDAILDYFIPTEIDRHGVIRRSKCKMCQRNSTREFVFNNSTAEIISCSNGIYFDTSPKSYKPTAVTEYDMVCENNWKAPLAVTTFQIGMALGSLSGVLADRFGRRNVFLWSSLGQVLSTVMAALSWNYYSYLVAMFFGGITGLLNYVAAFVLATEVTSTEKRNFMTFGSMYSYSIGFCFVPLVGYLLHSWRSYLWASTILSVVLYAPNYWLFPESARWLLQAGRKKDAITELNKMAKINRKKIDYEDLLKNLTMKKKNMEPKSLKAIDTLRMIFKSKLTSRCLVSFYGWFVVCLVYYAISYYSKSFSEDRYLNVLYAALTEIPAYAAGYYSLKFIGRPRSTLLFLVGCGIMSILLPFIPKENPVLTTFISVAGKGAVTAEFYVVYLAISEIVPTTQRSSSISIASFCGRIGSFIAPFVMFMDKIQHFIPNLILGGSAILCGILTILYIPETKGVELPDTTEQAENNNRFYGLCICRKYEPAKNKNFERGGHLIGHA